MKNNLIYLINSKPSNKAVFLYLKIMETNKNTELEKILTFLRIEFIDYKGKRCSNGHKTAKNIGQITDFFGKEIMTSGQFIEDINWFDFKNDWSDLIFLVEKIEKLQDCRFNFEIVQQYARIYDTKNFENVIDIDNGNSKIETTYKAVVEFINWYNKNK